MLSAVDKVSLNIRDQEAAKRFWVETMGFTLVQDSPMGDDPSSARWIEVRPPDGGVTVILYSPRFDGSQLGSLSNVLFTCDDIQQTYQELMARGVEFPTRRASSSGAGGRPSRTTKETCTDSANATPRCRTVGRFL